MNRATTWYGRALPALIATLALTGCGGGDGDNNNNNNNVSNTAPVADAGADQSVTELDAVALNGAGSDADNDTLSYQWSQTAGTTVTIANSAAAVAGFTAPTISAATETLTFSLAVSDGRASHVDTVDVTITNVNQAPVADAGIDLDVDELVAVTLTGFATDADNDVLTYAWTQTAGQAVTIADGNLATAGFDAPDVAAGAPETLTFQLTVSDGTASASDTVSVTVTEPAPLVTVTGKVNYEFVPPNNNCAGLDFGGTFTRPIRRAPVQLIDAGSGTVLATTESDDSGDYAFPGIDANATVRLRVRAELRKTAGASTWDVEVRDNFDNSGAPPPLDQRPLYVVEGPDFSTGSNAVHLQNLTATTGWDDGASSYTGSRAAAPFAILDTILKGMLAIETADPDVDFPPLDVFWSVNNTVDISGDVDLGELGASFYRGLVRQLFLLGDAASDTEEFDDHVVMHEWGHYFEDAFSRSDSIGGAHAIGEPLDARLSFGEGWASAFAAIVLDDPVYCDTGQPGTGAGFGLDTESDLFGVQGWFNEWNIATFIYDLWDTDIDGTDTGSVGWAAIFNTMAGPQANTGAFTSVFSFATELRAGVDVTGQALVDSQLNRYNIVSGGALDIWGTNETNAGNATRDVLPLYLDYTAGAPTIEVCVNSDLDADRDGNNPGTDRFLRLAVTTTDSYDVSVATTAATLALLPADDPLDDRDQPDPDIYLYQGPFFVAQGTSGEANLETMTTGTLQAGTTYVAAIEDWRFDDDETPAGYPDQICFDVTFSATP